MNELVIARFPLSHFDDLTPLLLRCFPNFWKPRLKRGMRSFPYDLKLFCARWKGRMIGMAGIHDYSFHLNGMTVRCGGLSDVGVDPDFRGRGCARRLQEFALEYCRKNDRFTPVMPLYTDKPAVYLSQGWKRYRPDRSREIRTEDFPLSRRKRLVCPEERVRRTIRRIYSRGQQFNGKCLRSAATWRELFAEPEHQWVLEADTTYYLFRKNRLLEAYSADSAHPVRDFVPAQGGHDANQIMLNLAGPDSQVLPSLQEEIRKKTWFFPIADTF